MQLIKSEQGYFSTDINGAKVILYLTENLLPDDDSMNKLKSIAEEFNIYKSIIGLPDLHFKLKNFVPSGMTIALKDEFSPKLLGPNNDGMGTIKLRIKSGKLTEEQITNIFEKLKQRIVMFRREKDVVDDKTLNKIFMSGIHEVIEGWGFSQKDLERFEDRGCTKKFSDIAEVKDAFPDKRPESLPDFVPNHDIFERGKRCLGVLDGTSHFIELFKVDQTLNSEFENSLDVNAQDYFFLVHAGAGDICIISHRAYLNQNGNKFSLNDESGKRAFNSFAVAGNYGFANRLYIYKVIKEIVKEEIKDLENLEIFSDVPHDYLEREDNIAVHRKGSVKLSPAEKFPKTDRWHQTGTPYVFPSCVGGDAYIVSNNKGNETTFNTVSHGAGRLLNKDIAIDKFKSMNLEENMRNKILLFRYGVDQIEGQNPLAFKDIDEILDVFKKCNLAQPITKLKPVASLKA